MGLDIAFNYNATVEAGLQTHVIRNGSDKEILAAEEELKDEPSEYTKERLEWLREYILHGSLDSTRWFAIDLLEGEAHVRANKWGSLYVPLTTFLRDNNITWEEY